MQSTNSDQSSVPVIYWLAAITSLFMSFWTGYRVDVINPDAICYLMSAQELGLNGLHEAMHICPQAKWPLYSILIYWLHSISALPLQVSANLLDAVFTMTTVISFIAIVRKLGASNRVLWFAAFTILFANEFNSARQYIVRDHGYWAFYMLSLWSLLCFTATSAWRYVFAWTASLIIATLFRIEGCIFLLLTPFVTFLNVFSDRNRYDSLKDCFIAQSKQLGRLLLPLVILLFAFVTALLLSGKLQQVNVGRFEEIIRVIQSPISTLSWRYNYTLQALVDHVLPPQSARDAGVLLFGAIVVGYILNVISNLYWVCTLVALYCWRRGALSLNNRFTKVLIAYLLVNVAITLCFYFQQLFLSKRYLIAQSLILLLWVPFGLDALYKMRKQSFFFWAFYISLFAIMLSGIGVFFGFGPTKHYIRDSGHWISENVPAKATFYTNDYQLMYYTERFGRGIFQAAKQNITATAAIKQADKYDYLAIQISRHDRANLDQQLTKSNLTKMKEFSNKHGDRLIIYRHQQRRAS